MRQENGASMRSKHAGCDIFSPAAVGRKVSRIWNIRHSEMCGRASWLLAVGLHLTAGAVLLLAYISQNFNLHIKILSH